MFRPTQQADVSWERWGELNPVAEKLCHVSTPNGLSLRTTT